jgi:hypothetical protein
MLAFLRRVTKSDYNISEDEDRKVTQALKLLTECLHEHHQAKCVLLIDEYDAPFNRLLNKELAETNE